MRRWIAALAVVAALPTLGRAQDIAKEGVVWLLVPVGARSVGQGQAVSASRMGADGIWTNPASMAWAKDREFSFDHSQNIVVKSADALDFVFPAGRVGVLSASVLFFNFGDQQATDVFGTTVGTIYAHNLVAALAYSATFGDRFSAGLTYKWAQQSQSCGGSCPGLDTYAVSTSVFDFGVQSVRGKNGEFRIGAVLRNIGFCAQVIDTEQCDPPPTRVHFSSEYRIDGLAKAVPGAALRISAEAVTRLGLDNFSWRAGAELSVASDHGFVRGGVLGGAESGDGSKATIGFGFRKGTLSFDFARAFGGLSADNGSPPTYITLRIGFK